MRRARTASTEATVQLNQPTADAGDPAAQYRVGPARCCAIGPVDSVHDNARATDDLCLSARQVYAPAQYLLGRIYAGKPAPKLTTLDQAAMRTCRLAPCEWDVVFAARQQGVMPVPT